MKIISLLGCGKIGIPLALKLLQNNYIVKGSTTTESKIDKLKEMGVFPYLINITENINLDFFNADILVVTLPFKKTFDDPSIYKNYINVLSNSIKSSSIKHVVFTSSSSVYSKEDYECTVTAKINPYSERSKVLLDCERIIYNLENISKIIIRLGGLYGSGRKITRSQSKRRLISNNDAVDLLFKCVNKNGQNQIINGFKRMIY